MSGKLMGKVYKLDLPRAERDVLLAMAENANDDGGDCFPGVEYLAWKISCSVRKVQYALRALEKRKAISVIRNHKGGRGKRSEYRLNLSAVALKGAKTSRKESPKGCKNEPIKGADSDTKGAKTDMPLYKERARIEPSVEPSVEPSERERPAPAFLTAVPGSARQVAIFERYYPGLSDGLSIYQREILGTMQNLADCESAIRYAAGNGFRARSVDKIVNQVFKNREWEKGQNGKATTDRNGNHKDSNQREAERRIRIERQLRTKRN